MRKRSPQRFVSLIGAEYDLLVESGSKSILRVLMSSLLIILVAILTFASIFYAMEMIFHHPYVEWLMAIFISGLFITIYIFLINTFSKKGVRDQFTLANTIRIGFILFMAFLIAYPLEVMTFNAVIEPKVDVYKRGLIERHNRKVHQIYDKEEAILFKKQQSYSGLWSEFPTEALRESITSVEKKIGEAEAHEQRELEAVAAKVYQSDFLLYRVHLVSVIPYCWLITLSIMLIFFMPGYLVYSIASDDAYYQLKADRDKTLIIEQYKLAEQWYTAVLLDGCGVTTRLYSVYTDPPFNSQLPVAVAFGTEKVFIGKFSAEIKPNGL